MTYLITILPLLGGLAIGYLIGFRRGRAQAAQDYADTLEHIQPSSRTPGQPTNIEGRPARVTSPRWRRRAITGDAQDE